MTQHAPVFIVLLPLTGSLLCMLFSRISRNLGSYIVMASIAGAFASACLVLQHVLENGGATCAGPVEQHPCGAGHLHFHARLSLQPAFCEG
mgnify:CR=1 FL=1